VKVARPVLRGPGRSNALGLPDKKNIAFYPRLRVDTSRVAAVGQAGGVLLTETVRVSGLGQELSAAQGRWRKPTAVHDPAKIVVDLVVVLALQGLRWGELAGLRVGDRVMVPGRGLRLSRAVLASNGGGALYVDTLKSKRARTVPLVPAVVSIVARWSAGKNSDDWLFGAPLGGPLRETNWKRAVGWQEAKVAIGRPELRVHDLRHTAASVWLGSGADPKVVQRVLGHATAAMTMDLTAT